MSDRRLSPPLLLLLLAFLGLGSLGCLGEDARAQGDVAGIAGRVSPGEALTVRQGTLQPRLLLTGDLVAARAEALNVPRTETSPIQVRWMEKDGVAVRAGQRVVEFDNTPFTSAIEEKRLAAAEAANELARKQAEIKTSTAEKLFNVEQRQAELDKARIAADVPEGVLATREYQERQTALRRSKSELAKAEEDLASHRQANAADLAVQRITLEKSQREIRAAERAIEVLTLKAPRDGIVVIGEHPWEGRKFQEGDSVFPGMPVATLPELASLQVEAILSDVDDGRVTPGMKVVATLDAYPAVRYSGRVIEVSPVAREAGRNPLLRYFPVKIALDRVDLQRMRPGMSVRAEVLSPERRTLLAPRAGLDLGADPPRALLAEGGSVEVRLGPCTANDCAVVSGLKEGQRLRPRGGETS